MCKLHTFIGIVRMRREVKPVAVLVSEWDGGINSERVVSSTNLCTSHAAYQIIDQDNERQRAHRKGYVIGLTWIAVAGRGQDFFVGGIKL